MHAKYQATMMTSIEPTGLAGWTLTRWDTDFSDDDMARLTALQAPLSALERASAVAVAESSERLWEARERAHLSQREVQVLQLAAAGLTAVAIGHRLRISARTYASTLNTSTTSSAAATA